MLALSVSSVQAQKKKQKSPPAVDSSSYQTTYVVVVAESVNYKELDDKAKNLSSAIGIPYDNDDKIYDPVRGIILPDDSPDEVYAGRYLIRREDEDRISIEMKDWYFLKTPDPENYSPNMIIIAGIFNTEDKSRAEDRLKEVKKTFPGAYIHTTVIYMGYIH